MDDEVGVRVEERRLLVVGEGRHRPQQPPQGVPAGATHTPRLSSRAAMAPAATPSGGTSRSTATPSLVPDDTDTHGCHRPA